MNQVYKPICHFDAYLMELEQFNSGNLQYIPVWIGDREDLMIVVQEANNMYVGIRKPQTANYGVIFNSPIIPEQAKQLFFAPLASVWVSENEFENVLLEKRMKSVLIIGLYADVSSNSFENALLHSYKNNHLVGTLLGRDIHSLLWINAKQWGIPNTSILETIFLSSESGSSDGSKISMFLEEDFETKDIRTIILESTWKRVFFQGHGKDDSINLGEFTVCGRNKAVKADSNNLYPRCGYGGACYKDESKLIPANEIKAIEIVLSSCNSGPLPQYALYDPKYQLMLNSIDGYAQTIQASLSVHDSDYPENDKWVKHTAINGESSLETLNNSLLQQHPYPAYWQIGMPPHRSNLSSQTIEVPSEDLAFPILRLQSFIITDLLPPNYPLRGRFLNLNRKINLYYSRKVLYSDSVENHQFLKSIFSDLQSLDYALKKRIDSNPEDDIMNYGSYYNDRGVIDEASLNKILCSCGSTAFSFLRKGYLLGFMNLNNLLCLRCGDKEFRLENAPIIKCTSQERIKKGETLGVSVKVELFENGPVHIGLFVPKYLRDFTTIEPLSTKRSGKKGNVISMDFIINFLPTVHPQAYYFTVYSIQNLSLSTTRQHFGIEK